MQNKNEDKKSGKHRVELLDDTRSLEEIGTIESTLDLETVTLKAKRWHAKFAIRATLPRSYYRYTIKLELDEKPYLDRISDLEKSLDDSLFKEERASRADTNKRIGEIKLELEKMREMCEDMQFSAIVEQISYKDGGTNLSVLIPDDIIEPLNRQKYRLDAYKVALVPQSY